MILKKSLKSQSLIEYVLLVAISIVGILLALSFWRQNNLGSLERHFDKMSQRIIHGHGN